METNPSYIPDLLKRLKAAYVFRFQYPEVDGYSRCRDEFFFAPWDDADSFTDEECYFFEERIRAHAEINESDLNLEEDLIDFESLKFYTRSFGLAVNQHFDRSTHYPTLKESMGSVLFEELLAMFNRFRKEGTIVLI